MAEVSSSHLSHQPNTQDQDQGREQQQEQELDLETLDWLTNYVAPENDLICAFNSNPLSRPTLTIFDPSASRSRNFFPHTDSDSDSDSSCDDDQMNFVTDLFASRDEEEYVADDQDSVSNPFLDQNFGFFDIIDGIGSNNGEDLGLGFGSQVEFNEFAPASEVADSGLRVAGIDSDSDSEEVGGGVNCGVHEDGAGPFGDSDDPFFWDCLGFEEQRARTEELEWEEVDETVNQRENSGLVIDGIEELSVSSEISSNGEASDAGDEAVRSLEWEILLAVNNLERSREFVAVQDDYVYETEYDTLFGQFVQNESVLKGSPPASKAVVENLPSVVLTREELLENKVVCAVCKDEISVEDKVTRLPCRHHYHDDCIVPWLCIRNTCPVCRYELPTDDLDYEQRKTQMEGLSLPHDLQILELIYEVAESQ
ncbi:uncharacterized protein LOC130774235 [Actinidia eriantha]|uniref:uncharacterized protein LOC130774235 n=1 Tax=Actinidia eriantha TaxID=165200 RepID=UPI00258A586E|nr:uncharacterized protein LOC130774235 [Actinidia eriantha]